MSDLLKIHLENFHIKNNAKFLPFAGYNMPINYQTGIINEHLYVRNNVGVFDVSHMGQCLIPFNQDNINNLHKFMPLNLNNLKINRSKYSFLLNSSAGIIDDIILSRILFDNKEFIFIVYNASRKKNDEEIFKNIDNKSDFIFINDRCLLAIQGPLAYQVLKEILDIPNEMNFLDTIELEYMNEKLILSRSGYTGEDGFELSIPFKISEFFLSNILKNQNANLCGLGSRDSLRVEAGLSLYGNEINENISPLQAGLHWALDEERLYDSSLNGQNILLSQLSNELEYVKIGIMAKNKIMLREKINLLDIDNKIIGYITSGCYSPILKQSIAMGYIKSNYDISNNFYCESRNKIEELFFTNLPFIKNKYKRRLK